MKRRYNILQKNRGAIFIVVLLITVALWAAYNLLKTGEDRAQPRISVLVEDSNNERWTAFRLGIDQAAREYKADVTFITSTEFHDAEDQKKLIAQEAAAGTEGLILSLYDSEESDLVSGAMKLVFVETEGIRDSSAGTAAVVPSGQKMGEALGKMILADSETAPSVAVITGNLLRYSEKEMLQGLIDTVESAGGTVLTLKTGEEDLSDVIDRSESCDMIAALEDSLLMQTAALAVSDQSEERAEVRIYGIGCSPSNITYLDRGVISGMVVPNEYTMGYQSLAQLSRCLANDIPVMRDIEVGFTCVRTDEVHSKANEKLLFLPIQ